MKMIHFSNYSDTNTLLRRIWLRTSKDDSKQNN